MSKEEIPTSESDFTDFTEYISIKIPVQCGERFGYVYTYSHRDHLKNSLLKNYAKELTGIIEKKKYCDSIFCSCDIGPTIAVANLIEDGEYAEFVQSFNHGDIQLRGLEHVLKVKERGRDQWYTHHLVPKADEKYLENIEQSGLIRFALIKKVIDEKKKIHDPNLEHLQYVLENDKQFELIRKEILEPSKISKFEGYPREYAACSIYADIYSKMKSKFNIKQEDVDTADSLTKLISRSPLYV